MSDATRLGTDSVLSLPLDSRPMTVIEIEGRPFFIATEIGAALGYAPTSFKNRVNDEWSDRLRPDKDVIKLEGEALRALKDAGAVAKNTPAALLLSESGLYRVLMLSGKPAALRLQEWLADEVLPAIRKTWGLHELQRQGLASQGQIPKAEPWRDPEPRRGRGRPKKVHPLDAVKWRLLDLEAEREASQALTDRQGPRRIEAHP